MDMESAMRANIESIAVLCGYSSSTQLAGCTDNVVENSYQAVGQIIAK
jgi:phosphoglycolate phosphatase-like HAD superfamily hydrolase